MNKALLKQLCQQLGWGLSTMPVPKGQNYKALVATSEYNCFRVELLNGGRVEIMEINVNPMTEGVRGHVSLRLAISDMMAISERMRLQRAA